MLNEIILITDFLEDKKVCGVDCPFHRYDDVGEERFYCSNDWDGGVDEIILDKNYLNCVPGPKCPMSNEEVGEHKFKMIKVY